IGPRLDRASRSPSRPGKSSTRAMWSRPILSVALWPQRRRFVERDPTPAELVASLQLSSRAASETTVGAALQYLRTGLMSQRLRWVIDIDIEKYFDSIPHSQLRDFLDQRVTDGVIRRMINKWLKAGILEDGLPRHTTEGSPQGGVISPCLSNIFLHHVLDEWFEHDVRPRLTGRCTLVRFADDAVMAFEHMLDAQRVLGVLGKRLARYALTLHPDKTRFVDFRNTESTGTTHPEADGTTFTFLGFTHIWGKS